MMQTILHTVVVLHLGFPEKTGHVKVKNVCCNILQVVLTMPIINCVWPVQGNENHQLQNNLTTELPSYGVYPWGCGMT